MAIPFTKTKLLAVEGIDEVIFFKELFKHIGMTDKVDLRDVGGKDQFKIKMPVLTKTTDFHRLEAVAIVRDADNNATGAFKSVKGILEKMGFKVPSEPGQFSDGVPRVGIYIMPDNTGKGMLEDLCLETVKNEKRMKCVQQYLDCAKESGTIPKNIAKAKVQAYLALMPEISNSIGRAAQKGHWNFDSSKLTPLINFLKELETGT